MTTNQDYEDAGAQQGFADLREGRSRRITPEVSQQEQDAASSETAWRKGSPTRIEIDGFGWIQVEVWPEAKAKEIRDRIIADHNAALASPAGADLALVRSTLESKIKDDRYHPQYILGMAFAHQLLESVPAARADEIRQLVEEAKML